MAFGHRALHYVQHTLCYLPEPFGLPFGREHFVVRDNNRDHREICEENSIILTFVIKNS